MPKINGIRDTQSPSNGASEVGRHTRGVIKWTVMEIGRKQFCNVYRLVPLGQKANFEN